MLNFICTFRTYFNTNNLDMYLQYETDNLLYSSDIYDVLTPVCTYITWKILELNSDNVSYEYTGGDRGWKGDVPKIKFDCSKIYKIGWKSKMNSSEAIKNSLLSMLGEIKK